MRSIANAIKVAALEAGKAKEIWSLDWLLALAGTRADMAPAAVILYAGFAIVVVAAARGIGRGLAEGLGKRIEAALTAPKPDHRARNGQKSRRTSAVRGSRTRQKRERRRT